MPLMRLGDRIDTGSCLARLITALALSGCADDIQGELPDTDTGTSTGMSTGPVSMDSTSSGTTEEVDGSSDSTGDQGGILDDPQWPLLECDPLVPAHCGYPFPNNVFSEPDDATVTGRRLALGPGALPQAISGIEGDPEPFNERDGFSVGGTILAHLPGATAAALPDPLHIGDSLLPASSSLLLDTDTGELVAHFSEVAVTAGPDERSLMMQPAAALQYGHRYIAAFQGVTGEDGDLVEASPAFAALRDGTDSDEPSVEERRALYGDIFARLAEVGVERDNLQLAWDFTVSSREHTNGRALHMRDAALASLGDGGPTYEILGVDEDYSSDVFRRIRGELEVPLYLDDPGTGGVMIVDGDDVPVQNGTARYPFTILVPYAAQAAPAPSVTFGHGLFGSRSDAESGPFQGFANTYNFIIISLDWLGMSDEDAFGVVTLLSGGDPAPLRTIADRLQQALLNFQLATRMMKTSIVDDPALQFEGRSLLDGDTAYYYGGSQGGIMGASYMALSTDVRRGALAVPGQSYNLLLERSAAFANFESFIAGAYVDAFDKQLLLHLMQANWDRAAPSGYSVHISRDPLPGTSAHDVMMLVSIGDHLVTTLGAHVMARSVGAVNLMPTNREIWGVESVRGPVTGSAMIEHSFGLPPEPLTNVPMSEGDDPHGALGGIPVAGQSIAHFLGTGEAMSFCDGVCDPD